MKFLSLTFNAYHQYVSKYKILGKYLQPFTRCSRKEKLEVPKCQMLAANILNILFALIYCNHLYQSNMKMTSFDVLFQKKMAAMFSSVSPLKNCSCIYDIHVSLRCSCIYRSRNNRQQLSLIKRKNGIQTTSLVYFVDLDLGLVNLNI